MERIKRLKSFLQVTGWVLNHNDKLLFMLF